MPSRVRNPLRGAAAIVGVGNTNYKRIKIAGTALSPVNLATKAARSALADASMGVSDIDGLITFNVASDALALRMELQNLRMRTEYPYGGRWVVPAIQNAAQSLHLGTANAVLMVLALSRLATYEDSGAPGGAAAFESMHAMAGPAAHSALMVRRYMSDFGDCSRALSEIAISNRQNATLNSDAIFQTPLTEEEYFSSRWIAEPLRLYDYCLVNDGAVAFVITRTPSVSLRKAVRIGGFGTSTYQGKFYGADDFYYRQAQAASISMFDMADVSADQVNSIAIYDNYTPSVLFALEGFGFVKRGGASNFVQDGHIRLSGKLPLNTSGGHTSEAYMQGMNLIAELVRQIRGDAGERQIRDLKMGAFMCVTPMAGGCVLWR
jgi:acetyl-CoA acetyltransferase